MTHVLAVDGNSLAHRAFHALRRDPDRPREFVLSGLVAMLATAWTHGPFDAVVIGFDHHDNRRKVADPGYKSHRDEKDPELVTQLAELGAGLTTCGFEVARVPGAEADDVMAAVADACTARGWRCSVLSSDRDLLALVTEDVTLLRPRGTMSDLGVYTPEGVVAEYGVRPEQYTDLAALRGDPSDGLDGVHGIGPKTAARLLRDYGDVPGIYANLGNLHPRVEAQLRAGRDNVERNLWLMAPIPHLDVDVDGAVARGLAPTRLTEALTARGLDRAAGLFRLALERPALPPMPPPPTEPDEPLVAAAPRPTRALAPATDGEQVALF